MKNDKFKSLYDSFTGQVDYCNFIESYGEEFVDFTNTNFDLLKAQLCGFYLTLILDEYFVEIDDKNHTTEFVPEFIQEIVKMIGTTNGKGYTFGNLSYSSEANALFKIRNKLAHGDFIIENGDIIYEEHKVEGRINLSKLISAISSFDCSFEDYFLTNPRKKVFYDYNVLDKKLDINDEKDFDKICKRIRKIEINDAPIIGKKRDANYVYIMRCFYDKVKEYIKEKKIDKIQDLLDKKKNIFKDAGINITYTYDRLSDSECYDAIKEKYMASSDIHNFGSDIHQLNTIKNLSFKMNKGRFQKFNMRSGILLNIVMLNKLQQNPDYTLEKIIITNPEIVNLLYYHLEDMILSSYLVGFNSLYEYGLEQEATQGGKANFIKIINNEQLDFSTLSLEQLDDPNMKIEHDSNDFQEDVNKFKTESINRIDRCIESCNNKLEGYLKNCKNQTVTKIEEFKQELEGYKKEKEELLNQIVEIEASLKDFDQEKYTRNLNIIYHIRNAIAHGNIFVDSYSSNILETEIIIRDFHKNVVSYQRKMKIKDFNNLFPIANSKPLYSFISSNLNETDSLIAKRYFEDLNLRTLRKMVRNTKIKQF